MKKKVLFDKNKFFSLIPIDYSFDDSEIKEGIVDIEMLRVGSFNHKYYGEFEITDEMLQNMIDNFNNDVIGREISFDWNHKAEEASGWLKELRVEDGVLVGTTNLTADGADDIENNRFKYFSIEFRDNYVDPESGDEYGPTVMGGALTNRPFITKLKKIEFSLEEEDASIYRLQNEEDSMKKKVDKQPAVRKTPVTDEPTNLEEAMELIKGLNDELEDARKKLDESTGNEEETVELQETIDEQSKKLDEMQETLKKLTDETKRLSDENENANHANKILRVEKKCDDLLAQGHHPSVVAVAKEIMLADDDSQTIKFEETVGEGEKQTTKTEELSLTEAVERLLAAIPKAGKADYTERTTIGDEVKLSAEEEEQIESSAIKKAMQKKGIRVAK